MSDEAILRATARAVDRLGPFRFTLADVAGDVGVTASAIAQRFGSKRALLLALVRTGADEITRRFRRARAANPSPTGALVDALAAGGFQSRAQVANSLAFLQIDLTDPEFHRETQRYFDAFRREVRSLLAAAVDARELKACDVDALTRAVEVAFNGSIVTWVIRGDGEAADALRRDVGGVIAPHVRRGRRRS